MLAEPRKRQKWSSDPRGASWSNDDSKFGQKMLEKMGWQKGKGLGAKEDGMTKHVKASLKFDQTGLGCSTDQADNWIAHQDDFDALLAGLNASHGASNGETESNTKTISIEEKSKSSKRRVHYHKFTRGKDLSSMSQADLACIMGKKASKSEPVTPNQSEPATPRIQSDAEDEDSGASCPPLANNYGVTTITKSQSIQDYFAQKMAELKKSRAGGEVESQDGNAKDEDSEPQIESSSERKSKKKSKKRKRKEQEDNASSESEGVKESASIRKKKKRERKEENNELIEMEVTGEVDSQKEKKKKKKRKEKELEVLEPQQEVLEENESSRRKSKKKKKSRDTVDRSENDVTQSESVTPEAKEERSSKKKKKSKKEKC
ncbi:PIN2/TERF1-interacting telomerase inhibitor 1-like [Branchiostoma lanceolatum]|uniref:PIN2/TERF1-interacting telomerase inhibitor 1-like n=1 Tax=Branchiostoma lanceolatum TaxID=7740 RepID=UPI003452D322